MAVADLVTTFVSEAIANSIGEIRNRTNQLTHKTLNSVGKIQELKVCTVRVGKLVIL
jgi:hypothetical protein